MGKLAGVTTNGHAIENMAFDGGGLSNYSVFAAAMTRSQVRYVRFSGGLVAGLFMGYGWINDVFESYFTGNLIGLYLHEAINSINVVDCNFEGNHAIGVIVNSGAMVRLEGNEFELHGGPAIVANTIRALTVRSNYFEANNANNRSVSFFDHHSGVREDVCTDVLLNGANGFVP